MLAIKTILQPTDFSKGSDHAFQVACSLARDYGARLIIVHVAALPALASLETVLMPLADVDWKPLRKKLDDLRPRDPNVQVEHWLVGGDPASEILKAARDAKADLIVTGTRGRTGLGRLLMGSVAEQVVRNAPCPVVTVRARFREMEAAENAADESASRAREALTT
jgi:nucleotide-binding universal stress UspA family protein